VSSCVVRVLALLLIFLPLPVSWRSVCGIQAADRVYARNSPGPGLGFMMNEFSCFFGCILQQRRGMVQEDGDGASAYSVLLPYIY
jgi:hypothetical protein